MTIELKNDYNINEIKELLSNKGETEINLLIKDKNQKALYLLQENRKFDINHLKVKSQEIRRKNNCLDSCFF